LSDRRTDRHTDRPTDPKVTDPKNSTSPPGCRKSKNDMKVSIFEQLEIKNKETLVSSNFVEMFLVACETDAIFPPGLSPGTTAQMVITPSNCSNVVSDGY